MVARAYQLSGRNLSVSRWSSPLGLAVALCSICSLLLLLLPIWPRVGVYNWDVVFWLDAAHRIEFGQVPHVDFFAPFGPLPQYGFWFMHQIFPSAHPIVAAQLFYGLIGLPLLALILIDVRSSLQSSVLAGAFIALLLLPANFFMLYINSGLDIGIYNRQAGLLLYVLVAAIWWCRSAERLVIVLTVALLALFFTKITTFLVASVLILFTWFIGRLRLTTTALLRIALLTGGAVWSLEIVTGIVSAYMRDISRIIEVSTSMDSALSEGWLGPLFRVLLTVKFNLDVLIPIALMIVAISYRERHYFAEALLRFRKRPLVALKIILRSDACVFSVFLLAGLAIESQNAGSQEFAFLIPAVWYVAAHPVDQDFASRAVILLAGFFLLLLAVKATHRTFLIASHLDRDPHLEAGLEPFRISAKPSQVASAEAKLELYSHQPDVYKKFASGGTDVERSVDEAFQLSYFLSVRDAINGLHRWQIQHGLQLKSIATLDFVDPLPMLLNLKPIIGLGIVMDPGRTVQRWPIILRSLSSADGILVPGCPVTIIRYEYAQRAIPELNRRSAIAIDRCWTLYVKDDRRQ